MCSASWSGCGPPLKYAGCPLRAAVAARLPRADLPEVLLEIAARTGFAARFTHFSEREARAVDLTTSLCAVLVAEACNTGIEPLVRADVPALRRSRLQWVSQNCLRQKTITEANACLVAAQGRINLDEAARGNAPLQSLLYGQRMLGFYERLLGGAVRDYDYTWFRAMRPGNGTKPHCDLVYMGRGTSNLFTAWVPMGDLPREIGGLMILENSHRQVDKLDPYLRRDVDAYCVNRPDAPQIEAGEKLWQDWDGTLTKNPASLREKLGGRWLTAEFRAGDLLTFGMATVHGSIDNRSDRLRLSSDSRYQLATEPVDERWVGENPVGHGVAGKRGKVC